MNYKDQSGIDVHSHWVPDQYIEDIKKGKLRELAFFVKTDKGDTLQFPVPGNETKAWIPIKQEMVDFKKRYQDMAETKVDKTVICPVPFAFHYHGEPEHVLDICRMLNDSTAGAVAKDTDRLRGLAHVPLQSPKLAIKELERAVNELNLSGVHLGTNVCGKYLGDEDFFEFFEAVDDLGAKVLIHPIDVAGYDRLQQFYGRNLVGNPLETTITAASLIFSGIFDRHPSLKIILVHAGGMMPYVVGRWDHGYKVRSECKTPKQRPSDYLKSFYYDIIAHSKESLRFLVERVGADRVVIGSDYPLDMGLKDPVRTLAEAEFDEKTFSLISKRNAEAIFNF